MTTLHLPSGEVLPLARKIGLGPIGGATPIPTASKRPLAGDTTPAAVANNAVAGGFSDHIAAHAASANKPQVG